MKQKETKAFSWTTLFFVIAVSFFSFSLITKIIEGARLHVLLFFITGVAALGLGLLSLIGNVPGKSSFKKAK